MLFQAIYFRDINPSFNHKFLRSKRFLLIRNFYRISPKQWRFFFRLSLKNKWVIAEIRFSFIFRLRSAQNRRKLFERILSNSPHAFFLYHSAVMRFFANSPQKFSLSVLDALFSLTNLICLFFRMISEWPLSSSVPQQLLCLLHADFWTISKLFLFLPVLRGKGVGAGEKIALLKARTRLGKGGGREGGREKIALLIESETIVQSAAWNNKALRWLGRENLNIG